METKKYFGINNDEFISLLVNIVCIPHSNNQAHKKDFYKIINNYSSYFTVPLQKSFIRIIGYFIIKYKNQYLVHYIRKKEEYSIGKVVYFDDYQGINTLTINSLVYRSLEYFIEDISINNANFETLLLLYNKDKKLKTIVNVYVIELNYLPDVYNNLEDVKFLPLSNIKEIENLSELSKKLLSYYDNKLD